VFREYRDTIVWPELIGLLCLMVVVWFLWNSWLIYPLKILVVFFHELSHGLAAILTGGRIVQIRLMANEGGLCVTAGGSRFLTLSAGYLGSLVFGGAILLLSAKSGQDRLISATLGAILLLGSLIWIRPLIGFGFIFAALAGGALIAAGVYLPMNVNDLLNKTIGLTSCLYALMDIKSDILDRPGLPSDAAMLGELTGIPGFLWGILWIAIALLLALFFLATATSKLPAQRGSEKDAASLKGEWQ
jgi:hypothetical protein